MTHRLLTLTIAAGCVALLPSEPVPAHPGHSHGTTAATPAASTKAGKRRPEAEDETVAQAAGRPNAAAAGDREPEVQITIEAGYRKIVTNSLPDHETGEFPRKGNPNRIGAVEKTLWVTTKPAVAKTAQTSQGWTFGVALNGITFDPFTAEFWKGNRASGWNYEAVSPTINLGLDESNAHVQPTGLYHYHGVPTALVESLGDPDEMVLIGYAADGFPIYNARGHADPRDASSPLKTLTSSYRLREGERVKPPVGPGGKYDGTFTVDFEFLPGSGDLDDCNGRYGVTPEYPQGTYYYCLTEEFPYVPRYFRGTPHRSFSKFGGRPALPVRPAGFRPPPFRPTAFRPPFPPPRPF